MPFLIPASNKYSILRVCIEFRRDYQFHFTRQYHLKKRCYNWVYMGKVFSKELSPEGFIASLAKGLYFFLCQPTPPPRNIEAEFLIRAVDLYYCFIKHVEHLNHYLDHFFKIFKVLCISAFMFCELIYLFLQLL